MHRAMNKYQHMLFLLAIVTLLSGCGTLQIEQIDPEPSATELQASNGTVENPTAEATTTILETPTAFATAADIALEIATATPFPTTTNAVYSGANGEVLAIPGCFDFDDNVVTAPPNPTCDLNFLAGPDTGTIEIFPILPAELAYGAVFPDRPTLADCESNSAFSPDSELVAPMATMYVCYRTGDGRFGYLHFSDADLEQAYTVTFDWLTFLSTDSEVTRPGQAGLNYHNENFGFQLTLPETWDKYFISEMGNEDQSSVCFAFVGSTPICVLQIDVYSRAAWDNLEVIPEGYYLGENGDFVFASGPYQDACVQLEDILCDRHKEIPAVLSSFVAN